jgi:uncharacterized membrane protein
MPLAPYNPDVDGGNDRERRQLGALAYFLVILSGLFLLVVKRQDRFVRFHALQSILGTVVFFLIGFVLWALESLPFFGFLYVYLHRLYLLALFLYWLYLMFRAWRGDRYRIPYVADLIEREFE